MIEVQAPPVMREGRTESFTVKGFMCPACDGNGWTWARDDDECSPDYIRKCCAACHGTGEVDAVVAISWKASEGKSKI